MVVAGAGAARAGLLPEHAFAVVVVVGIFATGALHQVVLVGRGHTVEGALSFIAIVVLPVGLAYAGFGPFTGSLATIPATLGRTGSVTSSSPCRSSSRWTFARLTAASYP